MTAATLAPVAAAILALAPLVARGDSISCAGGIVSVGDSKVDLLGKCGRPALEELRREETTHLRSRHGPARRVSAPVERWTYDFGRNQFLRFVRMEDGRVTLIETGSYGYAE